VPDLIASFKFALEIDGVNMGYFKKVAGIESETEVIEYKEATKDGKMIIRKVPGAMKWGDITLDRRIDTSVALWEWRKQVIDGDVDGARRNGSTPTTPPGPRWPAGTSRPAGPRSGRAPTSTPARTRWPPRV
jgi:phage tail-like protein